MLTVFTPPNHFLIEAKKFVVRPETWCTRDHGQQYILTEVKVIVRKCAGNLV